MTHYNVLFFSIGVIIGAVAGFVDQVIKEGLPEGYSFKLAKTYRSVYVYRDDLGWYYGNLVSLYCKYHYKIVKIIIITSKTNIHILERMYMDLHL